MVAKIIFGPAPPPRPSKRRHDAVEGEEGRGEEEYEGEKSIRLQITLARLPSSSSPSSSFLPSRSTDVFPFDCKLLFGDGCGGSGGVGLPRNHIFTLGCGPWRGGPSPSVRVSLLVMSSVRGDKNGSGSLVGTNLLDDSDLRHWETFSAGISCGMIRVHPIRHF